MVSFFPFSGLRDDLRGDSRPDAREGGGELEPEENTYQESSVFGKRFGNSGGVTNAVLQCFKEMGEDISPNVLRCNGAAECKKALMCEGRRPSGS